jgi:SAM-dependent MidA family methyltransferase
VSLTEILRAEIAAHGPMLFRDFMARALYDPQHGYYASGRARIGRKGDYFTSVSVGPLFGALLARQFAEVWEKLGRAADFTLVEQGAHDGTLAADVLAALPAEMPHRLTIIEPLVHWRTQQQEKLSGHEVRWVESVEALEPFIGVHYSNELLDAFPVQLLHRTNDGWQERAVTWSEDRFAFTDLPARGWLRQEALAHLPIGTTTEVNRASTTWMLTLGTKLKRGLILIIDYGFPWSEYYAEHRTSGTLEAIAAHRRVDPLAQPGEADLTTHVEFTTLAEIAEHAGLNVLGFTDQHHFLVALSRLHFAEGVPPDPRDARAFQTLAHPTMLGRAFKTLALGRGMEGPLAGFAFARDPRQQLGLP